MEPAEVRGELDSDLSTPRAAPVSFCHSLLKERQAWWNRLLSHFFKDENLGFYVNSPDF